MDNNNWQSTVQRTGQAHVRDADPRVIQPPQPTRRRFADPLPTAQAPVGTSCGWVTSAPRARTVPLPSEDSPSSTSDYTLHEVLTSMPYAWDMRSRVKPTGIPTEVLDLPAFKSPNGKTSFKINFSPVPRSAALAFYIQVVPRRPGGPITVRDVLEAIETAMYDTIENVDLACYEDYKKKVVLDAYGFRLCRPLPDVHRHVDLYPVQGLTGLYFRGIAITEVHGFPLFDAVLSELPPSRF